VLIRRDTDELRFEIVVQQRGELLRRRLFADDPRPPG